MIHPDFPNYQIYEDVRAVRNGKAIAQTPDKDGYLQCVLWHKGKRRKFRVHRLMAELYCPGFTPEKEVHHLNNTKTDNYPSNLFCCTRQEHIEMRHEARQKQIMEMFGEEIDEITVWDSNTVSILYIASCISDAAKFANTTKEIVKEALASRPIHGWNPLAPEYYFDRF